MNAQKMTQKSLEALQAAQSLAVEYENQALCPEHLFCALLSQQDGLIPQLFQKMGAEPGNLAAAFAKKVGELPHVTGTGRDPEKVYITPELDRALTAAEKSAAAMKDEYVSVEHLVLGMMEAPNAAVKEVLRQFHARRMELLRNAGADLLLIETQPSLQEALLEADLAEQMGADYWVSFTCGDDTHTWEGDDIRDCAKALSENHPHLKMIGVNCVAPHLVSGLVEKLKASCDLPIGVYPNSGETYDPITKTWSGPKDGVRFGDYAYQWMEAGVSAIGGCCQTVADHIRQVTEARKRFLKRG